MANKTEFEKGTSLWKDAWRRLLKNKLATFGMVVIALMILLVIFGPMVLSAGFGITPSGVPENPDLLKALPPSFTNLMGTDDLGRDLFACVRAPSFGTSSAEARSARIG